MKVYTEAIHFVADDKLIEFIERKLGKLDTFFDRIIEARVNLKLENSGQVRDKVAEIRIAVPGDVLIAKESEKTFEAAIDKLTDVLKRQLIKYKERTRETI
ncbi:MAG: ribosome-associated translation inhibitor RaiA [Bacteroidetes bacterium]|nr:MAG: ribosome-associated translation inhibitor RaiA [Bacteroidota bacterium]PTM09670.1 MAG: ribosome-associated translation inhibitor RaiA [Bacteroidota bacterium]